MVEKNGIQPATKPTSFIEDDHDPLYESVFLQMCWGRRVLQVSGTAERWNINVQLTIFDRVKDLIAIMVPLVC